DIADDALLDRVFAEHPEISCTIHCAALIVVPDSVANPEQYYTENVAKSLRLFGSLRRLGCARVVFSSSASVYDDVPGFMVTEDAPLRPRSPYARTKYMMEMILSDFCAAYDMRGIALRYFNPIGADPQMRSGAYIAAPSHVLGKMVAVATGREPLFHITGVEWPTRDGSGIRDYIHVWDLAQAHVKAMEGFDDAFRRAGDGRYLVINLGTGAGVTVKELVGAFEQVWGNALPTRESPARPGDVAGAYANADAARRLMDWQARLPITAGIADALRWDAIRVRRGW
ncbi:MAG TPA: NAD-dependent epimerase/dehydratase family protein, partial [Armatimonadota bacterium]|nr:NAD-dependent epimerase/dehydratase family protein [Armatimonadota bacterium]